MPHQTPARHSPYYPARARRSGAWRRTLGSLRATLHLERIHLPPLRGAWRILAAAVVPGLAFHFNGPRIVAKLIWAVAPLLGLLLLAGLGTFVGELAFALMIGAHVASVSHLLRPVMVRLRLWHQLILGMALFLVVSILFYIPARGWLHAHVAMPVTVRGQTIVIQPGADAARVQRGDLVAYRIEAQGGGVVAVRAGLGLSPVLGLAGDWVIYGQGVAVINGQPHPTPGSLKEWGAMRVPEECWFIWPELNIVNRGFTGSAVADTHRKLAVVAQDHFVGRPYAWWFFRSQGSK